METKMYQINQLFARENELPMFFVANQLLETPRAMYLQGHGTLESQKINRCCKCGRTLTHPVSVILGIGPECGGHFWNWDAVGGFSEDKLEMLKIEIKNFKIDQWFPKGVIKEIHECEEKVETPKDHPMLKPRTDKPSGKTIKLVKYQQSGQWAVKIVFPFDREILEQVKSLPGRKFHGNDNPKYWTAPLNVENVENLIQWGFAPDDKIREYVQKMDERKQMVENPREIEVPELQMDLFPFQKTGVHFIESMNGNALIGDEMGLGKTAQALAWLQLRTEARPAIVVVPASLKLNWAKEARMWMKDPNTQILSGTKPTVPIVGDIIIINYDVLDSWVDVLTSIQPKVMILDECHYVKNNAAKRTKAVKKLGKAVSHTIALSGTPIVNRPIELFNAIKLVDPNAFPNFWDYAHKYCGAKHNGFGWDFTGATNTEELHQKLSTTIMLRRLKKDVLKELPDKIYSHVPMELSNEKDYYRAERDFIDFIREQKGAAAAEKASAAQALAEIEGLKQLAVQGKLKQSVEWIRDFLDGNGKLVVMAVHKFVIDALMTEFGDIAVKVDGSVTGENRQIAVDRFQRDDKIRLFIGNIKAAGVGLTLTAASNVAFLELPWTPGDVSQAEDRCHRIGQKDSVTVHYLLAADTIEEKIARLIDNKRKVLDKVLDGKETDETSLLSELMFEYS